MDNHLIEKSSSLSKEASQVLEKAQVIKILSKLGKVEVIGSLRLNLLYRLDIDLLVISDDIDKKKADEATKQFTETGVCQSVSLIDYQTHPVFDMPLGFYWKLIVPQEGKDWKFDIWYLKPEERYTDMVLSSIKRFETALQKNPEKAEIVLKIKEAYFDGTKYKDEVKGYDIYTAVFEKNIMSIEEFSAFVKINASCE